MVVGTSYKDAPLFAACYPSFYIQYTVRAFVSLATGFKMPGPQPFQTRKTGRAGSSRYLLPREPIRYWAPVLGTLGLALTVGEGRVNQYKGAVTQRSTDTADWAVRTVRTGPCSYRLCPCHYPCHYLCHYPCHYPCHYLCHYPCRHSCPCPQSTASSCWDHALARAPRSCWALSLSLALALALASRSG